MVLIQDNRFTGGRPFNLPVFLRQNIEIFEKYFVFINKSIKKCVCTLLLIRYHIETDYYQEDINFRYNRQKNGPIEIRTPRLSV